MAVAPREKNRNKQSTEAVKKLSKAAQERQMASHLEKHSPAETLFHREYAQELEKQASSLLQPDHPVQRGPGGEAVPSSKSHEVSRIVDTLRNPDMLNLDASTTRLEQLADLNILEQGLDAAQSIRAKNSPEKMLAHQLAAAHATAMKLLQKSWLRGPSYAYREREPVDVVRMANAAVRLMTVFQQGLLTLQRLRTGGRQEVIVQHVNVTEGSQAVVAGKMKPEGRVTGGGPGKK